ncbi:TPA: FRG domain-containing protein [Legionella pneumophila]|uniref:FRG domain-containing protein n=1 Tax=Legionella pneumophila TaxID=446 RepID=UPI001A2C9967|nr:FRG domain-containing protein [Legionella pneumophila]MCW8435267.1 FRG domain-containing protein [Legionella pneumophila]WAI64644.1 FRG domain-containing protein [Legionella pneumophila]WAI67631.1 FRG domain-containing protein [Legionella pneumophila]HAT5923233.1 FRG domain-containing protein [Legionella pneumophila]HAT5935553.1 FRG domain-containing protein [Legionella pneumophila]
MKKIKTQDYSQIPAYKDFAFEPFQKGYIPVSRVESWQEFNSLFSQEFEKCIYRGHKEGSWTLSTSFSRLCNNPGEHEITEMLAIFKSTLKEMNLKDNSGNYYYEYDDAHLWGLGRHHGLLTPTLDWSYDPSVALFFAFEDPNNNDVQNPYSAIYLLDKNYIQKNLKEKIKILDSIHPENNRAINQKGLFTLTASYVPMEEIIVADEENAHKYFRKIYIRREDQKNCVRFLDKQGINKKTLYPNSLEGAVHYSNLQARKFFRSIFPGGPIITIRQKVVNPVIEKEKIVKKLKSLKPSQNDNGLNLAAECIFEIFYELRKINSNDTNFINKLDLFYNEYSSE